MIITAFSETIVVTFDSRIPVVIGRLRVTVETLVLYGIAWYMMRERERAILVRRRGRKMERGMMEI